jgi:ankyrin repeat protein
MLRRRACLALAAAFAVGSARAGSYEDFFLGIELDRPAILQRLLAKGFDVNSRSEEGQHGLYIALREQSFEVVPVLVQHPALEVDATNQAGETLLMMAALRSQHAAMRTLIERGAQVNRAGWTPLHYAASGGDLAAVKLLLERGAGINAVSPNGNTPLMMAAGFGLIDVADFLAGRGADARLVNKAGRSAADMALAAGRQGLAARLEALALSQRP